MKRGAALTLLLGLLLAACIARLWLLPLRSSFWVDEMVTAFVVHYGAGHASLAVAPQVTETVYYSLPRLAERLLGFSEVVYRLPSTFLMAGALWAVFRVAARLIHGGAGWFAVFACLTLRIVNYQAADARPYALGTCAAAAGVWFLVRWMDTARWRDGVLFLLCAALLWRVHLIYWPFYIVFAAYTVARLANRDTEVTWQRAAVVYGLIAAALIPVALRALSVLSEAKTHVFVEHAPTLGELMRAFKWVLVAGSAAGAWALSRIMKWPRPALSQERPAGGWSTATLVMGWWLVQPLALFAFSKLTGNSVFVDRYLSVSLPGAALAATLAVGYFLPPAFWKISSAVFGAGVFLLMGNVTQLAPPHHNSDWRAASASIRRLGWASSTPVVYPSPFIEARPPAWRPDYPLPGFLYCHLLVYPAPGAPYLLPFVTSPEAERYAAEIAAGPLAAAGRFVIYGGDRNVRLWRKWFAGQRAFEGWKNRQLGPFGDVEVAVFENPARGELARNAPRHLP
jgi:hypothetical protein